MPDDIKPGDLKTANRITDISVLEEMYGAPSKRAAMKTMTRLSDDCRAYIAASPFLVMGTRGDVSPKGDPPGFGARAPRHRGLAIPGREPPSRFGRGASKSLDDPRLKCKAELRFPSVQSAGERGIVDLWQKALQEVE